MGASPSTRVDRLLAPLQGWTAERVQKASVRFSGLALKHRVYGTRCDERLFRLWLKLDKEHKPRQLFERFCMGKETKASSLDVLCAACLLSSAKFADKVDMCFRVFHTEFQYKLTQSQIRQMTRAVSRAAAVIWGPFDDRKSNRRVDAGTRHAVQLEAAELWEERWGRVDARRQVALEEVLEWIQRHDTYTKYFCTIGTTDAAAVMGQFERGKGRLSRTKNGRVMVRSQSMCVFSTSPLSPGRRPHRLRSQSIPASPEGLPKRKGSLSSPWKRKTRFLPTGRASLPYVLENMEEFLAQSLKIQNDYRATPLFHNSGIRELRQNFKLLDTDKSGTLSVSELTAGHPSIKATVKRIFSKERNHDKQLTFEEFLDILYPRAQTEEKEQMVAILRPRPQLCNLVAMDIGAVYKALDALTVGTFQVRLCDLCAVMVRTEELYPYVIRMSRFKRAKLERITTFEQVLAFLFPKASHEELEKCSIWSHRPELPNGLSDADKKDLRRLFNWYDENGDGIITKTELNKCLRKHDLNGSDMLNNSMVDGIFRHMDKEVDAGIDYQEFQDFFEFVWVYMDVEFHNHFNKLFRHRFSKPKSPARLILSPSMRSRKGTLGGLGSPLNLRLDTASRGHTRRSMQRSASAATFRTRGSRPSTKSSTRW